ncbi:riboflavin synthase [Candidatus Marinamargulisbacteria bacterium SCGC AG-343-D04]|nr:riboflavin synthase [Candidatus Marinamargulisbacteria bacterium SCGC AG-343-D04]
MFTGIITHIATVDSIEALTEGLDISFSCETASLHLEVGDSLSINGVCSTVVSFDSESFQIHYLKETCEKSTVQYLKLGDKVNIEGSLTPSSKMGGHFVSGHVDGMGSILSLENKDPWGVLRIRFDETLSPFFVYKGSVCIDGISLTLAKIEDGVLECHLIPHTLLSTILQFKKEGDSVNLECDMIGKYVLNAIDKGNLSV